MESDSGVSQVPVISVLEEVLQQHGTRLEDVTSSRNTEEASLKRNEATGWLRKTVGVVLGKDLPAMPSEDEFRLGLRSGKILCTALNKIQPGSVPKIVEGPDDSVIIPDGADLSEYPFFENVRNFLNVIGELGIPPFEATDLEQSGKSSRIVQCVLALKSYGEWKKSGAIGTWRYIESSKPPTSFRPVKAFTRRNSEPFINCSLSRTMSLGDKSVDSLNGEQSDLSDMASQPSLRMLVRAAILHKKQEEIPAIVESMITKVSEEYERRLASHSELSKTSSMDMEDSLPNNFLSRTVSCDDDKVEVEVEVEAPAAEETVEDESSTESEKKELPNKECNTTESEKKELPNEECNTTESEKKELPNEECNTTESEKKELPNEECNTTESEKKELPNEESTRHLLKQRAMVEQQQQYILELKHSLHATKVGMDRLQMMYHEEFNKLGKHLDRVTYAASGYKRVLEENRKLYNQVQDLKGNIRVYCRVRPQFGGQSNGLSCVDNIEDRTITVLAPTKNGKEGRKSFTFNKIFSPSATQAEVFSDTQPLIRSVLDGYNVCIFAYGQTGSGKTHTMSGPKELTEEGLGVNYRALGDLFEISNQRKETISYEILVQMLEIYNEQVKDLLATDDIRNSSQNGINVPDANLVRVSSTSDVMNLMNLGQKNRTVFSTAMNDRSSRSHSCLTVHVQGKDLTSGNVFHGSMHLVDLAGSERVDKSEVTGDRLKEAQHINKSLAALGDVIASLASKSSHVPYRNSKLTQLLQDSLGGQAKTLMFVHIAPEYEAHGETLSTLKFAERVATVELGAAKVNKDGAEVKELKDQIASLKAALAAAKKEGELEQVQQSQSIPTSPEAKSPSLETSPSLSKCQSPIDQSISVPNAENETSTPSRNESTTSSRRGSLELQEMLANPSLWPPLAVVRSAGSAKEDVKPVINKHDKKDRNAAVGNVRRSPTKVYPEQNSKKPTANKKGNQENDQQRVRSEVVSTDYSSDIDAAASDCSETDSVSQSSIPKTKNGSNGLAVKPKKQQQSRPPSPANTKNTESKSPIPSLLPSPANRKPSNGANPNANKPKRKTGNAK
ncbi:KINESIN-LIKE PROTEIN IN ARABIDOPSIS THALIANA D, kinesin 4 [Hibiscus trionum]|uniref:KINESIN-LIKE PROTEIN IN ARABIDOPSIS THALIANA D, kinesin 4 n=1 Tax=Hibiscus trionum TaxID=183268 RepID=A0A9W7LJ88_HIBTR|nr:KINESIN-LIKE PROTEIN IN ARABIDOPSIS THALIANA D, kinesin 4 [Hibiscus trionum]